MLVAEARFRAARGLDSPLADCTREVDAKLAAMRGKVKCIRNLATSLTAYRQPTRYGSGGVGYFDPTQYGGGYGGTYYRNGESSARGYQNVIPGNGRYSHTEQWSGGLSDRPVGVYGPKGRGLEFANGGVVLNLGGASIRLK